MDKSDVDKIASVPVYLRKLSDVVKIYVVKKIVYDVKIKNIKDKMPDITNLATNASLNPEIREIKGEIPSITNLAITAALTTVGNKMPNTSGLVKTSRL